MVDPTHVRSEDGALLTVRTDWTIPGGSLTMSAQFDGVAVALQVSRDDVRELVQALDDWLLDSRPR